MSVTDPPPPDCGFAERLDWLLAMIPRVPGGSARFSEPDLVAALTRMAPRDRAGTRQTMDGAREWLSSARAGLIPRHRLSGGFVAALEELFRLPIGYFRDEWIAEQIDLRILFAHSGAATGVRVHGPCRVLVDEITSEQLRQLHRELTDALDRRGTVR